MFGKKHPACQEHLEALARSEKGREESERALKDQQARASQEIKEVIEPLRALRERNHFAELIIANITASHKDDRAS